MYVFYLDYTHFIFVWKLHIYDTWTHKLENVLHTLLIELRPDMKASNIDVNIVMFNFILYLLYLSNQIALNWITVCYILSITEI